MKIIIILLLLLLFIAFFTVKSNKKLGNSDYYKENGKMFYYCKELIKTCEQGEVFGVDLDSFEVIEAWGDGLFAKDKKHIYCGGKIIINADPDSFQILNTSYSKDKNNVFYNKMKHDYDKASFGVISNIDPDNFYVLGDLYAKDDKNIFYLNKKIENADLVTFKLIVNAGKDYAIDENYVYFNGIAVAGADPETFNHVMTDYHYNIYYKDKNAVFKLKSGEIKKLSILDSETFKVIKHPYYKDKNFVLNSVGLIVDADSATFTLIGSGYAIDKNYVYYGRDKIVSADLSSFYVFDVSYPCAKDKEHVYVRGQIESGVSPVDFIPW